MSTGWKGHSSGKDRVRPQANFLTDEEERSFLNSKIGASLFNSPAATSEFWREEEVLSDPVMQNYQAHIITRQLMMHGNQNEAIPKFVASIASLLENTKALPDVIYNPLTEYYGPVPTLSRFSLEDMQLRRDNAMSQLAVCVVKQCLISAAIIAGRHQAASVYSVAGIMSPLDWTLVTACLDTSALLMEPIHAVHKWQQLAFMDCPEFEMMQEQYNLSFKYWINFFETGGLHDGSPQNASSFIARVDLDLAEDCLTAHMSAHVEAVKDEVAREDLRCSVRKIPEDIFLNTIRTRLSRKKAELKNRAVEVLLEPFTYPETWLGFIMESHGFQTVRFLTIEDGKDTADGREELPAAFSGKKFPLNRAALNILYTPTHIYIVPVGDLGCSVVNLRKIWTPLEAAAFEAVIEESEPTPKTPQQPSTAPPGRKLPIPPSSPPYTPRESLASIEDGIVGALFRDRARPPASAAAATTPTPTPKDGFTFTDAEIDVEMAQWGDFDQSEIERAVQLSLVSAASSKQTDDGAEGAITTANRNEKKRKEEQEEKKKKEEDEVGSQSSSRVLKTMPPPSVSKLSDDHPYRHGLKSPQPRSLTEGMSSSRSNKGTADAAEKKSKKDDAGSDQNERKRKRDLPEYEEDVLPYDDDVRMSDDEGKEERRRSIRDNDSKSGKNLKSSSRRGDRSRSRSPSPKRAKRRDTSPTPPTSSKGKKTAFRSDYDWEDHLDRWDERPKTREEAELMEDADSIGSDDDGKKRRKPKSSGMRLDKPLKPTKVGLGSPSRPGDKQRTFRFEGDPKQSELKKAAAEGDLKRYVDRQKQKRAEDEARRKAREEDDDDDEEDEEDEESDDGEFDGWRVSDNEEVVDGEDEEEESSHHAVGSGKRRALAPNKAFDNTIFYYEVNDKYCVPVSRLSTAFAMALNVAHAETQRGLDGGIQILEDGVSKNEIQVEWETILPDEIPAFFCTHYGFLALPSSASKSSQWTRDMKVLLEFFGTLFQFKAKFQEQNPDREVLPVSKVLGCASIPAIISPHYADMVAKYFDKHIGSLEPSEWEAFCSRKNQWVRNSINSSVTTLYNMITGIPTLLKFIKVLAGVPPSLT